MSQVPAQLDPSPALVRSWTVCRPTFYGLPLADDVVDRLEGTQAALNRGMIDGLDPSLCRVVASFHGPKGAKVPLSLATISGCIRPAFVAANPWLLPNSLSCYDGGCYLFHARAVPAKKAHEVKIRAHTTPLDGLCAAARISKAYGLPLRDNQSSDGSLSMALAVRGSTRTQLHINLQTLADAGYSDVPYLCFSAAYTKVTDEHLRSLGVYPNLVVHITVSGWHSRQENLLRLHEFERYSNFLHNVVLRVVNRQDWAAIGAAVPDSGARVEAWLLGEINRRGLARRMIRTPFHSVHSFPGSNPGSLGTRHMAGADYSETWDTLISQGTKECCTTGKCKTCPTQCGATATKRRPPDPLLGARALQSMLLFELARQARHGQTPLALYTARLLARKGGELYAQAGDSAAGSLLLEQQGLFDSSLKKLTLSTTQRHHLVNDSHALVMDGLDRHRLWANTPSGNAVYA